MRTVTWEQAAEADDATLLLETGVFEKPYDTIPGGSLEGEKVAYIDGLNDTRDVFDYFEDSGVTDFSYLGLSQDAIRKDRYSDRENVKFLEPSDLTGIGIHGYAPSGHSARNGDDISIFAGTAVVENWPGTEGNLDRFYDQVSKTEGVNVMHITSANPKDGEGSFRLERFVDARLE